jgi:Fic family protein
MHDMENVIQYVAPTSWIKYDSSEIFNELTSAKAAVMALKAIPYQRRWVEELQKIQLKMEIAGTSQIEGADFAANELEVALKAETPEQLFTRSQKQASAAVKTYKWIASLPDDVPFTESLICEVHRLIVTDCDADHCPPGEIRKLDQNVTFGVPKHRGVIGGPDCDDAFRQVAAEVRTAFQAHDPLVQALALHYHFAAMHPFLDGNGRTARAMEALVLQRAGLRDTLFIAMSNYYYEEKRSYLAALSEVRSRNHDLTPFLKFGLKGIALQSERLTKLIRNQVEKQIFRNLMHDLFTRLQSTRKRVIVKRQLLLLEKLLNTEGKIEFFELTDSLKEFYSSRKDPYNAAARDVNKLGALGAVRIEKDDSNPQNIQYFISVVLDWPTTITDTEFFARIAKMPKSKTFGFLSTVP